VYGTVGELAVLLRLLHDLEPRPSLVLPELRPFARVDARIDGADLAEDDRAYLRARVARQREQYAGLDFVLPAGPVHGDANIGNILRRQSDGAAVLIDLDGFASQWRPLEDISHLVGHVSTSVTETVYRQEIRPALTKGATAMDKIFKKKHKTA
jgi:thiamine kinase-like enzyme